MGNWICDKCTQLIEQPEDGWLEWLCKEGEDGRLEGRGLRLVHHYPSSPLRTDRRCQYDERLEYPKDGSTVRDFSLKEAIGPDGLMRLLQMLRDNELPQEEVIEIIKRLNIPGYEIARSFASEAVSQGIIDLAGPDGFLYQQQIDSILEYIEDNS